MSIELKIVLLFGFIFAIIFLTGSVVAIRMKRKMKEMDERIENYLYENQVARKDEIESGKATATISPVEENIVEEDPVVEMAIENDENKKGVKFPNKAMLVAVLEKAVESIEGQENEPLLRISLSCNCIKNYRTSSCIPEYNDCCVHGNNYIEYSAT